MMQALMQWVVETGMPMARGAEDGDGSGGLGGEALQRRDADDLRCPSS
jgi:hypothetical protein